MRDERELIERVERQARRMKKAKDERPTVIGQTVYIGTLGLVFVLPVIAGAYAGHWLDDMADGYSMRWTLSPPLRTTARPPPGRKTAPSRCTPAFASSGTAQPDRLSIDNGVRRCCCPIRRPAPLSAEAPVSIPT